MPSPEGRNSRGRQVSINDQLVEIYEPFKIMFGFIC